MTKCVKFKKYLNSLEVFVFFLDVTKVNEKINSVDTSVTRK